jgi:hypothetical protein
MSFATEFGKGFQGSMSTKSSGADKDNSGKDSGLVKKVSGLFKRPVQESSTSTYTPGPAESARDVAANRIMGQAKTGGKIPKTGNYKLHKGETVVPAGMARGLERLGKKGPQKIKPKKVSLGKKGSFTIKHPGAFKAAAKRAGMGTKAYAQKKKSASGVIGNRARSALGLMAMGK